jgi:hypothetical protein
MNKLVLLIAGLFFMNFASGAAQNCAQETEGKQYCISGESMKCTKIFDINTKAFKYEFNAISSSGQSISLNSPLYKKTAGYTPMPCSDAKSAKN